MRGEIVFRGGRKGPVQTFALSAAENLLGRDPGIAVSIPREGISRQHARILVAEQEYEIEDLGSTNGTFVNGTPVQKEPLRHLDVIGLGKDIELIFLIRTGEQEIAKHTGILDASLLSDAPNAQPQPIPLGEMTLGRSAVCTLVFAEGAVSKIHCRIVRTRERVSVEDLGSSNGTFVNGHRVLTAVLGDGDTLGIAGVALFKVQLQLGEIAQTPAHEARPTGHAPQVAPAPGTGRHFSPEWKTRFEWDPEERAAIEAFQQQLKSEEALPKAPASSRPAKPMAAKPEAAKPPAAKAEPPTPKVEPPKPAPVVQAAVKPEAKPEPPKPAPPSPTVLQASPPEKAAEPQKPATKGRIAELRLHGGGFDVVAKESGAHSLGRSKESALCVNHRTVSRNHARLIISEDRTVAYVQDRGGANGTRLNGALISEITVLKEGDNVQVGDIVLVVAMKREP